MKYDTAIKRRPHNPFLRPFRWWLSVTAGFYLAFAVESASGQGSHIQAQGFNARVSSLGIESLDIKDLSMRQVARLLSQGSNWKIVVSKGAADTTVSTYLEDVQIEDALRAICQAYGLWFKRNTGTDIITIVTLEEYQRGLEVYAQEDVRVVTLHYPDARAVGDSLHRLFRDRVVWIRPKDDENNPIDDVEKALERMDLLADRAQFSLDSTQTSSTSSLNSTSNSRYNTNDRYSNSRDRYGNNSSDRYGSSTRQSGSSGTEENRVVEDIRKEMKTESLLELLNRAQATDATKSIQQRGIVYVSAFQGANNLLLRSTDSASLDEIEQVIKRLDRPKPQVLLEVKVLDITLDNEDARGVDWIFQIGDASGAKAPGLGSNMGSTFSEILSSGTNLLPQGTGLDARSMVLQVVTDNVLARIQFLEEQKKVTRLATPTLCVADNEASRVFVGTETTILSSISVEQSTTSGDNPVTTTSTNPETERRNIGTTLLITPHIHADRTATIRIVQEDSMLGDMNTINYGTNESFASQNVETRSVVTTVLAADGKISAIGGLIREEKSKQDIGVPVLKDIPLIGMVFKNRIRNYQRHELLVLIRPFILLAPGEAESVSENLVDRLSWHPSVQMESRVTGTTETNTLFINDRLSPPADQAPPVRKSRATIWSTP